MIPTLGRARPRNPRDGARAPYSNPHGASQSRLSLGFGHSCSWAHGPRGQRISGLQPRLINWAPRFFAQEVEKVAHLHIEGMCDPHQGQRANIQLSALDLADRNPVNACSVCQPILCQSGRDSGIAHAAA